MTKAKKKAPRAAARKPGKAAPARQKAPAPGKQSRAGTGSRGKAPPGFVGTTTKAKGPPMTQAQLAQVRKAEARKKTARGSQATKRQVGRQRAKVARKQSRLGSMPAATTPRRDVSGSREIALAGIQASLEKKALLPVLIDVSAMASYADFIGVVSGRSDRQVEAIAESIHRTLKEMGHRPLGREGSGSGRWALLDYGDVVFHVFYHPVREFYDLESLWIDAPRVKLDVPPDSMHIDGDTLYL